MYHAQLQGYQLTAAQEYMHSITACTQEAQQTTAYGITTSHMSPLSPHASSSNCEPNSVKKAIVPCAWMYTCASVSFPALTMLLRMFPHVKQCLRAHKSEPFFCGFRACYSQSFGLRYSSSNRMFSRKLLVNVFTSTTSFPRFALRGSGSPSRVVAPLILCLSTYLSLKS